MKKNYYLEKLYNSNKAFIIYKAEGGYDLFTDFSEKIVLNNKNINNFFHKINKLKKKNKFKEEGMRWLLGMAGVM